MPILYEPGYSTKRYIIRRFFIYKLTSSLTLSCICKFRNSNTSKLPAHFINITLKTLICAHTHFHFNIIICTHRLITRILINNALHTHSLYTYTNSLLYPCIQKYKEQTRLHKHLCTHRYIHDTSTNTCTHTNMIKFTHTNT